MRWLDKLTLGMHLSTVRTALAAEHVTFEERQAQDEEAAWSVIGFVEDGFQYMLDFDYISDHLDKLAAWHTAIAVDDASRLLRELATAHGTPLDARVVPAARDERENATWMWPERVAWLSSRRGEPLQLNCDVQTGSLRPPHITVADARVRCDVLARLVREAPTATGARGAAIERWRQLASWRCASMARFVAIIGEATPDAPIAAFSFDELAEHVRSLAQHEQLFTDPDDWRDAIVAGDEHGGWSFEHENLGWQISSGREDRRRVRHISGAFAYGVHRVLRTVDELHAVPDNLPLDDVRVTAVPRPDDGREMYKLQPHTVIAALGDRTVTLAGYGDDLEQLARLLVCVRAERR